MPKLGLCLSFRGGGGSQRDEHWSSFLASINFEMVPKRKTSVSVQIGMVILATATDDVYNPLGGTANIIWLGLTHDGIGKIDACPDLIRQTSRGSTCRAGASVVATTRRGKSFYHQVMLYHDYPCAENKHGLLISVWMGVEVGGEWRFALRLIEERNTIQSSRR